MKRLAQILAECSKPELQIFRVMNETLNVTNGSLLIRRHVALPNGAYQCDREGRLVPIKYKYGLNYPDIELMEVPFPRTVDDKKVPLCQLAKEMVGYMLRLTTDIKDLGGKVVFTKDRMYMRQNPEMGIAFPFNFRTVTTFNPGYLRIVLGEMINYDSIYIVRDFFPEDGEDQTSAVGFGVNWGSCALLKPLNPKFERDEDE